MKIDKHTHTTRKKSASENKNIYGNNEASDENANDKHIHTIASS